MNMTISRFESEGEIHANPSKSYMQRAIVAGLLAHGETVIIDPSYSNDSRAAIGMARKLGADIFYETDRILVNGGFSPRSNEINCGESGLGIRLFTAVAALYHEEIMITGDGSLLKRPMEFMKEPLVGLGANCHLNNGLLPIKVKGPLKGGKITMDASLSSQFLTGLLMSLPLAKEDSILQINDLKSNTYIDMTLEVVHHFGIRINHNDYRKYHIPGQQEYQPANIQIEGDWSGAAFLLVAGALGGPVTVKGLKLKSRQGDRRIMEVLHQVGAHIGFGPNEVSVKRDKLRAFRFDATHCPDLFPPLVSLAAHCEGTSRITGVGRLAAKESDRATVLQKEFSNFGVHIRIDRNTMFVKGGGLQSGMIDSHNDHRIAMAGAILAAGEVDRVEIIQPESVRKSYPDFYNDLKLIGGIVNE